MGYNLFPAVDPDLNFPSEIREKLANSEEFTDKYADKALVTTGRLSEDSLDDDFGAEAQAAGILNPEDPRNDSVLTIVGGVVPPGVYYPFQTEDLNAPRPAPPTIASGQKVLWEYISENELPLPSNMISGDKADWIEKDPLPWTPEELENIIAFFDASLLSVADGDSIYSWPNRVGTQPSAILMAEIQTVTISGTPTGGSFTLTFSGQTTAAINWNATASDVQTALRALSNIGSDGVVVTGGPGPASAFMVTFGGTLTHGNVSQMTATSSLTGGTSPNVTVTTTLSGMTAPIYDADGLGSHPTIVAAGSSGMLASGFANLVKPFTIYVYGAITGSTNSQRLLSSARAASATVPFEIMRTTTNFRFGRSSDTVDGPTVDSAAHLFRGFVAAATSLEYELDDSGMVATGSSTSSGDLGRLALFSTYNGGNPVTGKISCVVVVNGVVSSDDEQKLLDWIDSKYGTTFGA